MVVSYASAHQTADSIIERLVAASGRAPQITVVTADEVERRLVESLGAMTASPTWLRDQLEKEGASLRDELDRIHRSARWK